MPPANSKTEEISVEAVARRVRRMSDARWMFPKNSGIANSTAVVPQSCQEKTEFEGSESRWVQRVGAVSSLRSSNEDELVISIRVGKTTGLSNANAKDPRQSKMSSRNGVIKLRLFISAQISDSICTPIAEPFRRRDLRASCRQKVRFRFP